MAKQLTIKVAWGGLGDHLLHSHLPRLAKTKYDYEQVFISNKSIFYGKETRRLVWELNPYVDGFNDDDHKHPHFTSLPNGMNLLDAVAEFYGLSDPKNRFAEPEIYYEPDYLSFLHDKTVFEPNHRISIGIPTQEQTEQYFVDHNVRIDYEIMPIFGQSLTSVRRPLSARTLMDLCNIVHSCKRLYCYLSGVATLAAALGKSSTVLYVDGIGDRFRHSKLHEYVRIQ